MTSPKRLLFLIADTGGGHRSAACAITAALDDIASESTTPAHTLEHRVEDIAAHCAFPLSHMGPAYGAALRHAPPLYGGLYHATNGKHRYHSLIRFCEPLYRRRLRDLFLSYEPDAIISLHPLLNHTAIRSRDDARMRRIPFITVITDLGRSHVGWLLPEADAIIVPAAEVYEHALAEGIPAQKVHLLGHPIHPKFERVDERPATIRERLGLPTHATIALLMAGGEGAGKLADITLALARAALPLHLVVVTGRNARLRAALTASAPTLPTPMTVFGFRDDIPELMGAADFLLTKAGPGAIAEAGAAALPIIVYDHVPGQERGNLDYVRAHGIGAVALRTRDVITSVRLLVADAELRNAMRERQKMIAIPGSARAIAAFIMDEARQGVRPATPKYQPL